MGEEPKPPQDLSTPAIKLARRLDILPAKRCYQLVVMKVSQNEWLLSVVGKDDKVEILR